MIPTQTKLGTYLALGAGCSASIATGATVVTTFVPGTTTSYEPAGGHDFSINFTAIGAIASGSIGNSNDGLDAKIGYSNSDGFFTQGANLNINSLESPSASYLVFGMISNGAVVDGVTKNYLMVDIFGNDDILESVFEMILDGNGNGYFTAVATNDDNNTLTIRQAVTAINAVPEPSGLALLALGSVGLAARRQRRKTA